MKFDGIAAFVATAEAGSISAASRRLGLAKSVVSERLAELERSLGNRLIQRTTRKLSLTEGGHMFLPRAQRILREAQEAPAPAPAIDYAAEVSRQLTGALGRKVSLHDGRRRGRIRRIFFSPFLIACVFGHSLGRN